jgi:hypothetical protein
LPVEIGRARRPGAVLEGHDRANDSA